MAGKSFVNVLLIFYFVIAFLFLVQYSRWIAGAFGGRTQQFKSSNFILLFSVPVHSLIHLTKMCTS